MHRTCSGPLVNQVYPLLSKKSVLLPNPCFLWVVDPALKTEISRLEASGKIIQFEQRLKQDPKAQRELNKAHASYAAARWSLLTEEHQAYIRLVVVHLFFFLSCVCSDHALIVVLCFGCVLINI